MTGRTIVAVLVLALVFAFAVGSVAPRDLLLGLAVGAGAVGISRAVIRRREEPPSPGVLDAVLGILGLAAVTTWDIARGTVQVALVVLGRRPPERAGFVEVPFEDRTDDGARLSALMATMSPGEVVLHMDAERRVMLVHTIDARDPDALRARMRSRYRHVQRRIWP